MEEVGIPSLTLPLSVGEDCGEGAAVWQGGFDCGGDRVADWIMGGLRWRI